MADEILRCPACGDAIKSIEDGCPRCGNIAEHFKGEIFLPGPRGPVSDFAFLFTRDQFDALTYKLETHYEKTKIPVVVATLYAPTVLGITDYASLLYNYWGIGHRKVNKGVLILLCTSCKRIESEVGTGLEKYIGEKETDDALTGKAAPYLAEGRFYEGVDAAVDHLMAMIEEKVKVGKPK